jgi:hypothetical protein
VTDAQFVQVIQLMTEGVESIIFAAGCVVGLVASLGLFLVTKEVLG